MSERDKRCQQQLELRTVERDSLKTENRGLCEQVSASGRQISLLSSELVQLHEQLATRGLSTPVVTGNDTTIEQQTIVSTPRTDTTTPTDTSTPHTKHSQLSDITTLSSAVSQYSTTVQTQYTTVQEQLSQLNTDLQSMVFELMQPSELVSLGIERSSSCVPTIPSLISTPTLSVVPPNTCTPRSDCCVSTCTPTGVPTMSGTIGVTGTTTTTPTATFCSSSSTLCTPRQREEIRQLARRVRDMQCWVGNFRHYVQLQIEAHKQDMYSTIDCVSNLASRAIEMETMFNREHKQKKYWYNLVQDMRGKIRTYCRVRPCIGDECTCTVDIINNSTLRLTNPGRVPKDTRTHYFEFDCCFGPNSQQQDVFHEIEPTVTSILDGYNVCVFAYGQTGSGKTHTMQGASTPSQRGVYYNTIDRLFELISEKQQGGLYDCFINLTLCEVYNEHVYDLLKYSTSNSSSTSQQQQDVLHCKANRLDVRQVQGQCQIIDLTHIVVTDVHQVIQVLEKGLQHRSTNSTCSNSESSRSHCILTLHVTGVNKTTKTRSTGKLNLIDLAGSERISKSKSEGERRIETNNINKSLTTLGRVITALYKRQSHIPYRESKLTYLLQDSLTGDSKVILVATISPTLGCVQESLSTLKFASTVSKVELGEASKHVHSSHHKNNTSTCTNSTSTSISAVSVCDTMNSSLLSNISAVTSASSLLSPSEFSVYGYGGSPPGSPHSSSPGLSSTTSSLSPCPSPPKYPHFHNRPPVVPSPSPILMTSTHE
eukprot:NODE_17_length_2831_cov_453.213757_g16_i0.p1 GENE.NODE_17_length_2831_cov_453.213757_g16_i0~~NODE_17_length_2831_cov_453.213757_g16_i0.p1  ORF type:complete len:871 (+),score=184.65 NODE_17_length_2831_cov_453.213757_g16_i0:314-2614(+)